ncbi:hypothetical protein ACHWQZ_G014108 [Mnemiopsis leidyi]
MLQTSTSPQASIPTGEGLQFENSTLRSEEHPERPPVRSFSVADRCWSVAFRIPPLTGIRLTDNTLTFGSKPLNHSADGARAAPKQLEILSSLKRKAAEQPLSMTQNLLWSPWLELFNVAERQLPDLHNIQKQTPPGSLFYPGPAPQLAETNLSSSTTTRQKKSDELNEVTSTVRTEMKSFSTIVKNCPATLTRKTIEAAVKSACDKDDRSKNIIIYGIEESSDEVLRDKVENVLQEINETVSELGFNVLETIVPVLLNFP